MLNSIIQGCKTNHTNFEFPIEVKKQEVTVAKTVTNFDLSSEVNLISSKLKFTQSNNVDDVDDDDDGNARKDDDSSDISERTVLYYMNNSNRASDEKIGKTDLDLNKKDFFSSDCESSSSSSNCENKFIEKKKQREKNEVLEKKKITQSEEKENSKKELNAEERELEKLLLLTELNPNIRVCASVSEDEKQEKEKKNEKKSLKSKKEEMSLLDCLESENCENAKNFDLKEEEEEKKESSFFCLVNNQIKKTFLLSSDESYESIEGTDNEISKQTRKKKKKKLKRKKEVNEKLLGKKDELNEFRIPNLSPKEKEALVKEISKVELTEKDSTNKKDGNDNSSIESDDSVKCIQHVKNRQRLSIDNSEKTTETDSDLEIEKVFSPSKGSPTKGRKNIKKILKKESLQVETKQALKMETDRKKRVSERQKLFEAFFPNSGFDSKLVLDFDPETKEELVVVDEKLSQMLKPHQREGIRFMWNCCFESLKRLEEDSGSGCVLAHCMGLGKTLQVISLVHTVLTHNTGVHTVMIVCPLNTIRNWTNEFGMWQRNCRNKIKPVDLILCKSKESRMLEVRWWLKKGGVLVISYEMFRSLIKKDDKNLVFFKGFLNPGPDLVVCDEGHVLKNNNSGISKCISQIKTLRRIILTGTPLQNNLVEYYCMVQFVKPNILGTMKEFRNRFVHPINNGQFEDSTELDVLLMKRRSHVLHTMLDGFVQRFGYYVLMPFLPEKQEYVISIALTKTQENIYRLFIERCNQESRELLKDFHWLQRIWTHPRVLMMHSVKYNLDSETRDEWSKFVREEEYRDIRSSGKLFLLFSILRRSKEIGDKVLVFSQFLYSLDLIEFFLQNASRDYFSGAKTEFAESWVFGLDYFRLDGSTNSENRDIFCRKFNDIKNKRFRLFLVSTKAGGLGISLVAANRVVVFDASWNPTHDVQSIFRVYRFGQEKPCFIYRFLAGATMEEKIYKRQVTKLSLAHRILDEHQIERHYTMGNLQELYRYDPLPKTEWKIPKIPKDNLFAEILANNRDIIIGYHEHDSLLENKEEEELTEEDRRAAWEDYEKEKLAPDYQLPELNGMPVPVSVMNKINWEGLKAVQSYKLGGIAPPTVQVVNDVQNESQLCKIVDVRTLQEEDYAHDKMEKERLLGMGRSLGLRPFEDESLEKYCKRINETFKTIFPWATSSQVIRGVTESVKQI